MRGIGFPMPERAATTEPRWKGFALSDLAQFGIEVEAGETRIPYLTRAATHYRTKVVGADGSQRWAGPSKPLIPFGAETLSKRNETIGGKAIYVTEGESDAIALRLAFPNSAVLGIPGASAWKPEWARLIEPFGAIYLSFDADEAGKKLLDAVKHDVPKYRAVLLPTGADTRDVLQQLGRPAFNALTEQADREYECRRAWTNLEAAVERSQGVNRAWQERAA
jgi:DNA primase